MSEEGKRVTAAVLSEARTVVPEQLVEALALEPLAISSTLLISRAEISDATLMKVIAARGESHARIIQMRKSIGDAMRTRIDQLIEAIAPLTDVSASELETPVKPADQATHPSDELVAHAQIGAAEMRDALRRMMMRHTVKPETSDRMVVDEGPERNLVARLINLALTGDPDLLSTAFADELQLPFPPLRRIVRRHDIADMMLVLKGMELGATDCFAILAAVRPLAFATAEAIARYHLAFQSADEAAVSALISRLKSETEASKARIA
jgi:uncharacterized protein (DUF2336 family)